MRLTLRGTVPANVLGVSYRRRVENPAAYAGHCMAEALRRAGIRVSGATRLGETPGDASLITSRRSPPLAEMLGAMGKWSDNFTAEMIAKVLGAERARPGSTARGMERIAEVLARAGVPAGRATLINGSGLFDGNLVAASHVTRLLVHVYQSPAVRDEYLAHLAVGGVEGTLQGRLEDVPRGSIRAKTGTLDDVIALSGYAIGPDPARAYAFSVLINGASGHHAEARGLADDIARALANDVAR
jgi:D-alanyl-D-alanine carboxypeptidase/D-alanyl-D-alanine-endopeptidase (penicillin-binding protein 4)